MFYVRIILQFMLRVKEHKVNKIKKKTPLSNDKGSFFVVRL